MKEASEISSRLLEFFQMVLGEKSEADQTLEARSIADAVRADGGGWAAVTGPLIDWLKQDRSLWLRACRVGPDKLEPKEDHASLEPLSALILSELLRADIVGAVAFITSLDEPNMYALERVVPDLSLEYDVALALFRQCSRFRGDGQSPALADKLMTWATRNQAQALSLLESRLAEPDGDNPVPIWAVEPIVEAMMQTPGTDPDQLLARRTAVLDQLLASANPRRHGLAAYLSCVAWPPNYCAIEERHAALLAVVRRSPSELISVALDAIARDVWDHQDTVFNTLVTLGEMVSDAVLNANLAHQMLRGLASVAARGVATLKERPLPAATKLLVALLRAVPPGRRDHNLDHLLAGVWKHAPHLVTEFLDDYVHCHAIDFLRTGIAFDAAFSSVAQQAGRETLGGWLVQWIVDGQADLRHCAASWMAGEMEIGLRPAALASLSLDRAKALVHVLAATDVPEALLFSALTTAAETRDDLLDLVRAVFVDELAIDYPVATRRWVEATETQTPPAKPSLLAVAAELRAKLSAREEAWKVRQLTSELFAGSPSLGIWMELHNEAQAVMQREAIRTSFLAQLMSTVHIARGEATTHSLATTPMPFHHQEFSYEQAVRAVLDPVGYQMVRAEHLRCAEDLLAIEARR